jgi:hypothetical protein
MKWLRKFCEPKAPAPKPPRKYGSLSHTGRALLDHLNYWGSIPEDALTSTREFKAMETLIRNKLATWYPLSRKYVPTPKGSRVKGWVFPK